MGKYQVLTILPISSTVPVSLVHSVYFAGLPFLLAVESVRPWASASANTSYPGEMKPARVILISWLTGSTLL